METKDKKITDILTTDNYLMLTEIVYQERDIKEMTAPVRLEAVKELCEAVQRVAWLEDEYQKFQRYIAGRQGEEQWHYCGNALDQTMELLNHYEYERNAAANKLGAFVEHMVVSLRAVEMIVKACYGLTHRQQSARMDILLETIQETLVTLMEDRSNSWSMMDTSPFSTKNWDFRRVSGENARLKAEVERLKNEIKTGHNDGL